MGKSGKRTREYLNYIGGKWVAAASGKRIADRNPADREEVIGWFPDSDERDVNEAVRAAREAFPEWSATPAPKRAEYLWKAANLLIEKKQEFARDMTREMGKVLKEAGGDVQEAIDTAQYIYGEGRRMFGVVTPSELRNKFNLAYRRPVGVVGVISPWNFPMAIPMWKIAPALVCGNTVVFKPSMYVPLSAHHLVEVFEAVGLPPGVLNLVHGSGSRAGEAIIRHPGVDLISFTGSTESGRHILEVCAHGIKKVSVELGGKNPIIVLDDADEDLVVEGVLWGAFGTTGQRCTATSRLILQKGIAPRVMDLLVERVKNLRLGDGLDPRTDVGPLINEDQLKRVESYVKTGIKEGARLVVGGKVARKGSLAKGYFFEPTIFTDVKREMTLWREEIFGPVLSVAEIETAEEAIELANDTRYGLSSSVYTNDIARAFQAIESLEAGITYVNAPTIGAEVHLPFGGVKETGNGHREGAAFTLLEIFSEWKTVYIDYSGRLQKAQGID
jgi:acyl-CoA reductase-like NAD-dependent aldehyde dehydrogenase